jgi:hypothetical protein
MSDTDLTIYNPQQMTVAAAVHLPEQGVQEKLLEPEEQWVLAGGVVSGQWVAFFNPETGALLAAALLPDNSTIAQLLLDVAISGLLRMNAQEPLTAANGIEVEVTARVQDVGASTPAIKKLAARGEPGSTADFPFVEKGQWLGFYDSSETYITGTWANSYSEVTLTAPRQYFVIGNPYPVTPDAGPARTVRLTVPAAE